MDMSKLVAARDKLNADLGTLIGSGNVTQAAIDNVTAEVTTVDNDVVAAIGGQPNPNPGTLDFTAFDAAVTAFKGRVTVQANVNALTTTIAAAN